MADDALSTTRAGRGRMLPARRAAIAATGFVLGVAMVALGLVLLDGAMGRFSQILVPGEGSAPIEAGTYVITRGPHAGWGPAPIIDVSGPDGQPVPIEAVSDRYDRVYAALAVFHAPTEGTYTIRTSVPPTGSIDDVAVERFLDGTGPPPTGAFSALGIGALMIVLSVGYLVVGAVRDTRASHLASLPPPPQGVAGRG